MLCLNALAVATFTVMLYWSVLDTVVDPLTRRVGGVPYSVLNSTFILIPPKTAGQQGQRFNLSRYV